MFVVIVEKYIFVACLHASVRLERRRSWRSCNESYQIKAIKAYKFWQQISETIKVAVAAVLLATTIANEQ